MRAPKFCSLSKHCGGVLIINYLDNVTGDVYDAALRAGSIVTLEPDQSVKDWAKHFKGRSS